MSSTGFHNKEDSSGGKKNRARVLIACGRSGQLSLVIRGQITLAWKQLGALVSLCSCILLPLPRIASCDPMRNWARKQGGSWLEKFLPVLFLRGHHTPFLFPLASWELLELAWGPLPYFWLIICYCFTCTWPPPPIPILHEAEITLVYITPQEDIKQFYNLLEKKKTLG